MSEFLFNSLVTIILGGCTGLTFGFLLCFGELVKPISLFFNKHENEIIDHFSDQFSISIGTGLAAILIFHAFNGLGISKRKCDGFLFMATTIGFILFTSGCLVVGWEQSTWARFHLINLLMIAPGVGLTYWCSLTLVLDRIHHRFLLAFYMSSPALFILVFFPAIQLVSSNEFYLPYRTLGTVSTPIMILLAVLSVITMSTPVEYSPVGPKQTHTPRWWASFAFFAIARGLFVPVFTTSIVFYPNYIVHIGGYNQTGFDSIQEGLEDQVVRDSFLWVAFGMVVGRTILCLLPYKITRLGFHAGAMGVLGGWYVRAHSTVFDEHTGIDLCALGFFLGLTVGSILIDTQTRTFLVGVVMLVGACCTRFSAGYYGLWLDEIDWPFVVLVNLCVMGGVTLLELISLALYPHGEGLKVATD